MDKDIPKRTMPEFKIGTEYMDNLKTVAAVTDVMSKNEDLVKQIADVFKEIEMEKQRELVDRVTALIADKVKTIPADKIKASFAYWYILSPAGASSAWTPHDPWRTYQWSPLPICYWVPR